MKMTWLRPGDNAPQGGAFYPEDVRLVSASRAARGLLNWKLSDLAAASAIGLSTLKHFETCASDNFSKEFSYNSPSI